MMRPSNDLPAVYLCRDVVDFRKGINGLAIVVEEAGDSLSIPQIKAAEDSCTFDEGNLSAYMWPTSITHWCVARRCEVNPGSTKRASVNIRPSPDSSRPNSPHCAMTNGLFLPHGESPCRSCYDVANTHVYTRLERYIDIRYIPNMLKSLADKTTRDIYDGVNSRQARKLPPALRDKARRLLDQINAAPTLDMLRIPPSNRLEKLKGDRAGFWSLRINDQWRIVFRWQGQDAIDVQVIDYH